MAAIWKFLCALSVALVWHAECCIPEGSNGKVTIGQKTYVCLVFNSQSIIVVEAVADQFTRFVVTDSYKQATACSPFYFPNGCTVSGTFSPTAATTAAPSVNVSVNAVNVAQPNARQGQPEGARELQTDKCLPSLYYGESMGVRAIYQKAFATCPPGNSGSRVAPVVTLVVQVNRGVVESVIWDDGCFGVCPRDPNADTTCMRNAFSLTNDSAIQTIPDLGEDCASTKQTCDASGPNGCDLTVYVVWTGIDSNGNYFSSAGRRPSRFTQFGLSDAANAFKF